MKSYAMFEFVYSTFQVRIFRNIEDHNIPAKLVPLIK